MAYVSLASSGECRANVQVCEMPCLDTDILTLIFWQLTVLFCAGPNVHRHHLRQVTVLDEGCVTVCSLHRV